MERKVTVYYDGLCVLCSREIDHYRRQAGSEGLLFVDITDALFNAQNEGVDPLLVHKVMHVKAASGELKTGVDAFITIWQQLPKYQRIAKIAQNKTVQRVLNVGYQGFVKIRPYLPRKSRDCESSPYCALKETR